MSGDIYGHIWPHQRYALEERDAMIERDGWNCWRCGCFLPGQRGARAHRIARTKTNLKEYGPYVLDHRLNIKHSCEHCNSYAMHFDGMEERETMLAEIVADLTARGYPTDAEDFKHRERKSRNRTDAEKAEARRQRDQERKAIRSIKAKEAYRKKLEWQREYDRKNRKRMTTAKAASAKRIKEGGEPRQYTAWVTEEAKAEYRQAYFRLRGYIRWVAQHYKVEVSKVETVCTAHELRKIEKHRANVEACRQDNERENKKK